MPEFFMSQTIHHHVLIIGSGPAGYTAAIYAARANLKPGIVAGMQPGGQLTITTDVENFPGFPDGIQGPELMLMMQQQAERFGTIIHTDIIVEVDFSSRPFKAIGDSGVVYTGDAVIVCTGASARWLGLHDEKRLMGYGVSGCATCDGFFYRGEEIAVIGGGDTAMEEANYLTNFASKVTLIHRSENFRASRVMLERTRANPKIEILTNKVIQHILGEPNQGGVQGLELKDTVTGAIETLTVKGVFIAIGHTPNTKIFKDVIHLDDHGYILRKPDSTATNIEGVFAAGDVADAIYRQGVTAAGMGCMAAIEVERWLATQRG